MTVQFDLLLAGDGLIRVDIGTVFYLFLGKINREDLIFPIRLIYGRRRNKYFTAG
ncbi:hypothetical protein [Pedobacter antarcticus]|uniref:hypothetical protein n=1 Tax=Pedobacter antarcticus TaxID=34086 RepID=UPI00191C115A|nr:hypothetical protein [Pedobacter antarcticus]